MSARLCATALLASAKAVAGPVAMDDSRWNINAQTYAVSNIDGAQALYLDAGTAELGGVKLKNGIIEFDLMNDGSRGFCGIYFRVTGPGSGENFYLRPHQSGNPDANQYTPLFNGIGAWQLYFGSGYSAPLSYPRNQWIHLKLVLKDGQADIYVDSDQPVLHVANLKQAHEAGAMVLGTNFAPAYFANFSYQATDEVEIVGQAAPTAPAPPGIISEWRVSVPFAAGELVGDSIPAGIESAPWRALAVEDWGFANLSRVHPRSDQADTVIAEVTIRSDRDQTRLVQFGYSDRVKVYLNDQLLYVGNNQYQSRDYRYLGTIGLFDALPLTLKAGENRLRLAVSEAFGGWGVAAALADREGLQIEAKAKPP